ncbi:mannose-1-phosphate guanylyltransferase [Terricaulis sp.]|uniref:mannose-1-phosphate guanylyltransferase n=1 Tax=Terricaulis sp. TaxID=2768686 RepID=UPI0037851F1A
MTKHRIIPAIMSGGAGTRLWPASTGARPKQFHALAGPNTLIQDTVQRLHGEPGALSFAPPMILGNASHLDLVREQLAAIGTAPAAIVLEPAARNTAAAGAVAAALAQAIEPGALVLLVPADHVIEDRGAFLAAIQRAAPFAKDRIVTFGIAPNRAETGYGYIKRGEELGAGVYAIDSFREKPNAATAQEYLDAGGYAWNAGMFLFDPAVMLKEFDRSAEIRDLALESLKKADRINEAISLDAALFTRIPSQPLDIAVMEKTDRGAVVPCDIGWADIGSWDEIWRISPKDEHGNGNHGDVVAIDAKNNLLRSDGPKVCVAGIDNIVVIATGDAVVILPRDRAQDVKLLKDLAEKP